jgi:hypothetical protein
MERVVTPLQTLVSRDQYESAYAVLCNVRTLAQRAPYIFAQVPLYRYDQGRDAHA